MELTPTPTCAPHGLSDAQLSEIENIRCAIGTIVERVAKLPRHRCLSLAITKLDEADLWLGERSQRGLTE